jgi:hypothetical protein
MTFLADENAGQEFRAKKYLRNDAFHDFQTFFFYANLQTEICESQRG